MSYLQHSAALSALQPRHTDRKDDPRNHPPTNLQNTQKHHSDHKQTGYLFKPPEITGAAVSQITLTLYSRASLTLTGFLLQPSRRSRLLNTLEYEVRVLD